MCLRAMVDVEYFRNNKLIIYGTGYVAHMFYKALKVHNLQANVLCCVTTYPPEKNEVFEGIPVYGIQDINTNTNVLICIAVHESIRTEIENVLKKITDRYIWIYPCLYELLLGKPAQRNTIIRVERLLEGYKEDLRLAIRLAAIEQHDGKNDCGQQYYINAQMIHCEKNTADKRWKRFMALVDEWKRSGYNKQFSITVNTSYEVIDGDHRVSMAVYTGQQAIYGNIYKSELSPQEIHENGAMMSEYILMQNGFTRRDIEILKGIQRRYMSAYERK